MTITDWPLEDRPREKLLNKGANTLTDAELLAIFLKTGTRGCTALDMAKALLMKYGDLKKLLQATPRALTAQQGIGPAKLAALKAAAELGRRYVHVSLPVGTVLDNSQLTQQFLADRLRDHTHEVFACLFMDTHFRLIHFEELFHGTINEAMVYPREIAQKSLLHHAAKIILAHNHPSGRPLPSTADKEMTQRVKQALALIDIEVIDHIIIGNPDNFSFADGGLI